MLRSRARARAAGATAFVEKQADAVKQVTRGAPHLYDLAADPQEKRNVVLDHKDVVAEMQERLRERYQA